MGADEASPREEQAAPPPVEQEEKAEQHEETVEQKVREAFSDYCIGEEAQKLLDGKQPVGTLSPEMTSALLVAQAHAAAVSAAADKRLSLWATVSGVTGFLAIAAFGFAIWQFDRENHGKRIDRSMSLLERGNEGSVANAGLRLGELYKSYLTQEGVDAPTFYAFATQNDPLSERAFELIVVYWEQMAVCVDRDLCDEDTIKAFVGTGDREMFETACPYIGRIRDHAADFAVKAETLLGADCGGTRSADNLTPEL